MTSKPSSSSTTSSSVRTGSLDQLCSNAFISPEERQRRTDRRLAELKTIQAEIADIERKDKAAKGKGRAVYQASGGAGTVMLLCQDRTELRSAVARDIKALERASKELEDKQVDREGLSF